MDKRYGFALGGGGARAFTELGAIKELGKKGIFPSILSGTSMGAVNAVLLGAGYSVDEVIWFYAQTDVLDMFSLKLSKDGFISNEKLGMLVEEMCARKGVYRMEDLKNKTYVVATDAKTEQPVTIKTGSIKNAIMATTSTIYIHNVLDENNVELKDGCFSRNVPFEALDEIKKDYKIKNFDLKYVCLDVIPDRIKSVIPKLEHFNKWSFKNDRARKEIFEKNYKGMYIDIHNDIIRTSFNLKTLEKALDIGKNAVKDAFAKKEQVEQLIK